MESQGVPHYKITVLIFGHECPKEFYCQKRLVVPLNKYIITFWCKNFGLEIKCIHATDELTRSIAISRVLIVIARLFVCLNS